jgi:hypothetical protein
MTLSLVPFVAFLVITGNVVVTASSTDLLLLKSTVTALEGAAGKSQTMHRLHHVCSKFYQIAVIIHDQQQKSGAIQHQQHNLTRALSAGDAAFPMQVDSAAMYVNNYPMLQQHWDGIIESSQLDFGDISAGELVTFVEPYLTNQYFSSFS